MSKSVENNRNMEINLTEIISEKTSLEIFFNRLSSMYVYIMDECGENQDEDLKD